MPYDYPDTTVFENLKFRKAAGLKSVSLNYKLTIARIAIYAAKKENSFCLQFLIRHRGCFLLVTELLSTFTTGGNCM